ncbi:hypothetical protein MSAN_01174400 [Mycena sanguinolenta]|uniref:Uncharacterized protein n=1 Tax=Mycena sanguinolenta TaxID=230812 RepID=A0A8H6YHN5_9AGAR|nr:hypothetical protein MSAN_01174400 [Mycena sanguinolenta]
MSLEPEPLPLPQSQPLPFGLREGDLIFLDINDIPSPERRRVVRPQFADPNVKTPNYMWVVPSRQGSPFLPSAGFNIMIRQEYYNLLAAVLWSLCRQSQVANLKQDFPPPTKDDQMYVEGHTEVPQDMRPDHLRFPDHPLDIFEETAFPNPFKHSGHGHYYRLGSALTITGLAGIGMTLFLSVIFYLRVAAELPTAYIDCKERILVYDGQRLFVLLTTSLVPSAVPRNAWVLVDSNTDFLSPLWEVVLLGCFIVQAASPSPDRTTWTRKLRGPHQFGFMRPWTLEELFAASSLQPQVCSGTNMQAFFNKFGGSAGHVYQESHNLSGFESRLDKSARSLDNKVIQQLLAHGFSPVCGDGLVGHMLITALPLNDEDRTKFRLASPTAYLEGKLLHQLNANIQMARRELYAITVARAGPGCQATAKDLLVKHHHEFIALGGQWRLREFTKVDVASSTSETNLWRASQEESDWVLGVNGRMAVFRKPLSTRPPRKRAKPEFTALPTISFPPDDSTRLKKERYYTPIETDFPMFDSFYMDSKGHGLIFQVLEGGQNPHRVKEDRRPDWLESRGVTKFTCILVSGPSIGEPPSILVSQDQDSKFDTFFHLVLEYPELLSR